MKSIFLNFTMECSHCHLPMPVNRVAEKVICPSCLKGTDTSVEFWKFFARAPLMDAIRMEPETESGAKGMHAMTGSFSMTYGNRSPRCQKCGSLWRIDDVISMHEDGESSFFCGNCKTYWSVRKPPEWFRQVIPYAEFLAGETADESAIEPLHKNSGISIFCYNCGSNLSLDGSKRDVKCKNCGSEFLIPDEIWIRLHPATVSYPWYIFIDLNEEDEILPYEISDFHDLEGMPNADTVLLWMDHDGNYILGRSDEHGMLRWKESGFENIHSPRLFYAEKMNKLWIISENTESVHCIDAETGEKELTIENDDHDPGLISVINNYNSAVCHDNTVLVYRLWWEENPPKKTFLQKLKGPGSRLLTPEEMASLQTIRRFDSSGKRIPLWPGLKDEELDYELPDWDTLHDYPVKPPHDALIEAAPDGSLYMIHRDTALVARFNITGKFLGVIQPSQKAVEEIADCGVSEDGSVYILFYHRKKIGGLDWSHIGKIGLDGSFHILAGPHAPEHNFSFGSTVKRMSISSRGNIHICEEDFNNLRILNPDGSLLWRSPGIVLNEENVINELNEARGKRFR